MIFCVCVMNDETPFGSLSVHPFIRLLHCMPPKHISDSACVQNTQMQVHRQVTNPIRRSHAPLISIFYTIHHIHRREGAWEQPAAPGATRIPGLGERSPTRPMDLPNQPNKIYGPYTTPGQYTTHSDATISPFVSWREKVRRGT